MKMASRLMDLYVQHAFLPGFFLAVVLHDYNAVLYD